MGLFDNFPYTNFHELNLDWIAQKMTELVKEWAEKSESWENWKTDTDAAFADLKKYVTDYFASPGFDEKVRTNVYEYLEQMEQSGALVDLFANLAIKKIMYYTTAGDFRSLEGLSGDDALYNWDVFRFYDLYDALPLTRTLVGYASNSEGTADRALPIYAYRHNIPINGMSTGETLKKIVLTSGVHGNEKGAAYALYEIVKAITSAEDNLLKTVFAKYQIDIIPICNPYGWNDSIGSTEYDAEQNKGRLNARGVDLNRNFDAGWVSGDYTGASAASELETQEIKTWLNSIGVNNLMMAYDFHTTFNDPVHDKTSQVYMQASPYTYKDSKTANDTFSDLVSIEKDLHDIDLTEQFINITLPQSTYNGQMQNYIASIAPCFYAMGLFEGGKRFYDSESDSFIYNDHRNITVMIDVLANFMIRAMEAKEKYGTYNKYSITPIYSSFADDWVLLSANRVDGAMSAMPKNKKYMIWCNGDYAYNFRTNEGTAGNTGFSSDPRVVAPASGYRHDILIKRKDEQRFSRFDMLTDVGLHIIPLTEEV